MALINVVEEGDYQFEQEMPLGLASIGAFLRDQGYEVLFHQCFAGRGENQVAAAAEIEADVFGFQLAINNYFHVRQVTEAVKAVRPGAVTVFGGPFLVSIAQKVLNFSPTFDYIVVGEGEATLLELLQGLEGEDFDPAQVEGLVWRDEQGQAVQNPFRRLIRDLDELPFPARDFLEEARRDPVDRGIVESIRINTSRGCVGKCSFCCVNAFNKLQRGQRWRGRSPEHVVDELEGLTKGYGARIFNFADSSFEDPGNKGKVRSGEICREIIRRGLKLSAKIYMRCETMKSEEDVELLKLYKRAGIDVVIIGAEAGSDYELRLYQKPASLEEIYHAALLLRDLDMFFVLVGFIMFGPNSNPETLRENIEFLHRCRLDYNLMPVENVLMLIKDCQLYHLLREEGRVIEPDAFWEMPKYVFLDQTAEKMARHCSGLLARFPVAKKVNDYQVNLGNLIARFTNPMNTDIFEAFQDDYLALKAEYRQVNDWIAADHRDHFLRMLELAEADEGDDVLSRVNEEFYDQYYRRYIPLYQVPYEKASSRIAASGYGMSGLVFRHFIAGMQRDMSKRI